MTATGGLRWDKAAFCISIDVELAWGVWDRLTAEYLRKCLLLERPIVRRLLGLFQVYDIPATWAIVGRLLERPDGGSLPGGTDAWYAPDIVDAIRRTHPQQEIGSHSFAHLGFGLVGRDRALADLRAARDMHRKHDLPFVSFVYPGNRVAHLDLLAEVGVEIFRSTDAGWHARATQFAAGLRRVTNLLDKMVPVPPPAVRPLLRESGVVELPSSMLLLGRNGLRRLATAPALVLKARLGLERAVREQAVFHLWFHPSNFYYHTETQFQVLEKILAHASRLRREHAIETVPMGGLAHLTA